MYVNFDLMRSRGITYGEYLFLLALKQASATDMEKTVEEIATTFEIEELDKLEPYIKEIKGKKNQSIYSKLRLSEKGKKLLEDLHTANVEDWHIKLADWIKAAYESDGKKIGNKKRLTRGLAQFAKETGITHRNLALLWVTFFRDEDMMEYSFKAENVIFSSKNIYQRAFNLDECRLWDYYNDRKEEFDEIFNRG